MNTYAVRVIYKYEMYVHGNFAAKFCITCYFYGTLFVVFGSAIGSRIQSIEGVPYGSFIVPGLMMLDC